MTQVIGRQARCAIARGVDLLGDKWALLIAREACWGRTRFSEFRRNLGIAPDVLANRLAALVHEGVLERRAYRDTGARAREEYVLTPAGHDLLFVLAGLAHWGREHRPLPESSSPSTPTPTPASRSSCASSPRTAAGSRSTGWTRAPGQYRRAPADLVAERGGAQVLAAAQRVAGVAEGGGPGRAR